jgi:hypothetical protein
VSESLDDGRKSLSQGYIGTFAGSNQSRLRTRSTELTCRELRRRAGVGCRNGPQVGDPLTRPDDDDPPSRVIDDV